MSPEETNLFINDMMKAIKPLIHETVVSLIVRSSHSSNPNACIREIAVESLKRMGKHLSTVDLDNMSNLSGAAVVSGVVAMLVESLDLQPVKPSTDPSRN